MASHRWWPQKVVNYWPSNRRKRGKPCLTSHNAIREAIEIRGIQEEMKNGKIEKPGEWDAGSDCRTPAIYKDIKISKITCADDLVIIAEDEGIINKNLEIYSANWESVNMTINIQKTETMVVSRTEKTHPIRVGETKLERVKRFRYLGSKIA